MTASITSLTARRAITETEKVLAGPRLKAIVGHTAASDILPISAPLLEQLLTLARGAAGEGESPYDVLYAHQRTTIPAAKYRPGESTRVACLCGWSAPAPERGDGRRLFAGHQSAELIAPAEATS